MNAGDAYHLAPHCMIDQLVIAQYGNRNLRTDLPMEHCQGVFQATAFEGITVHSDKLIAASNAGARRRRARYGRNDPNSIINFRDLDTDTGIAARCADAYIAIFICVEVFGVRIKIADHSADSALKKLGITDRLNILSLDALNDLGE